MIDDLKAKRRHKRIVALIDGLPWHRVRSIAQISVRLRGVISSAEENARKNAVRDAIATEKVVPIDQCYGGKPQPDRLDELVEAIASGDADKAIEILRDEWPGARTLSVTRRMIADRNAALPFPETSPHGQSSIAD